MKSRPILNLLVVAASLAMTGNVRFTDQVLAEVSYEESTRQNFSISKMTEIKGWGRAIDPDGDCEFFLSKKTLLINVPGTRPHDLAAEINTINAPRVLQTVRGDFTMQVEVDGQFTPGEQSTLPGRAGYNGAGLVVMADSGNVVCLARAVMHHRNGKPTPYANFELRVKGELERIGNANVHPLPITGTVFLRLEQRGQKISGAVSTDGTRWEQLKPKELPMEWPKKLSVGVVAISTSTQEFNPRFSNFKIVR